MTKKEINIIAFVITFPISTLAIGVILGLVIEGVLSVLGILYQDINHYSAWFYCIMVGFIITAAQLLRDRKRFFKDSGK